jgi:hypothetical protein
MIIYTNPNVRGAPAKLNFTRSGTAVLGPANAMSQSAVRLLQ